MAREVDIRTVKKLLTLELIRIIDRMTDYEIVAIANILQEANERIDCEENEE